MHPPPPPYPAPLLLVASKYPLGYRRKSLANMSAAYAMGQTTHLLGA